MAGKNSRSARAGGTRYFGGPPVARRGETADRGLYGRLHRDRVRHAVCCLSAFTGRLRHAADDTTAAGGRRDCGVDPRAQSDGSPRRRSGAGPRDEAGRRDAGRGRRRPSQPRPNRPRRRPPIDGGWPRAYALPSGASILVYQPQIASWDKQKHLVAFSAVSYRATAARSPPSARSSCEADDQRRGHGPSGEVHRA